MMSLREAVKLLTLCQFTGKAPRRRQMGWASTEARG
jgi:hypothetical protein